jgi:hypothetical protein
MAMTIGMNPDPPGWGSPPDPGPPDGGLCARGGVPVVSGPAQALAWLDGALAHLARADPAAMTAAEQADCLRALEVAQARQVAARSAVLAAFTGPGGGMEADGQGSPRTWLTWQTKVSRPAASAAVVWMRRLRCHPAVAAALAAGQVSCSWARQICDWTDPLPSDCRTDAEEFLLTAAASGVDLAGLAELAEELRRRLAPIDIDPADDGFHERQLRLATHFRGAAKLDGDLTARCAAALTAVLDSLGKPAGPEDTRTAAQRHHDALEEMCLRLLASGGLPDTAGQPARLLLHMNLPDLSGRAGPWTGPGPAAAPGDDCDAVIVPVVTGHLNPAEQAAQAEACLHDPAAGPAPDPGRTPDGGPPPDPEPAADVRTRQAAGQLALTRAIRLLSGPAGLAAALRTGTLAGPAAALSLPLDIGAATDTIPVHLRRAVTLRDRHCRFPGCEQPPAACDIHHIIHRDDGGPTSLDNLLMLCRFHHHIAIHRWGWTITLHPDATTTAQSPGRTRTLHSHPTEEVA